MADDIPDFMREFDTNIDYGFTPVAAKPAEDTGDSANLEVAKVKSDVKDIKLMMNEIMQIVEEKGSIQKELDDSDVKGRFKEIEKIVLPFLYNLSKSNEPYIHWPNRGPIIKAQMDKLLQLTRGK
tara:strand:+ start:829 stop:1203 length:375 start_codon:yes stop_codon:yes gene_type:complete